LRDNGYFNPQIAVNCIQLNHRRGCAPKPKRICWLQATVKVSVFCMLIRGYTSSKRNDCRLASVWILTWLLIPGKQYKVPTTGLNSGRRPLSC
jgi:hypothetical protein